MAKKASKFDRPVNEWSDREVELERLRLDAERTRAENSLSRRYGAVILSAVLTLAGTGITYYVNQQADERARKAENEETARTLAQNAVRLYFEHPDRFDLASDEGQFNLRVLAATAPGETTDTLLNRIQRRADEQAVTNAAAAAAQVVAQAAPAAANAAAPIQPTAQAVQKAADDARYAALQKTPTIVDRSCKAFDYTLYVQYGADANYMAGRVQAALATLGYSAPRVSAVPQAVALPEVRYFRADQAGLAQLLAADLSPTIGTTVQARFIGEGRRLPDGIMEVWLPPTTLLEEQARLAPVRASPPNVGDPRYRERACLERLTAGAAGPQTRMLCTAQGKEPAELLVEGMYWLKAAQTACGGDRQRAWGSALKAFEAGQSFGDGAPEVKERLVYGARFVRYCAGLGADGETAPPGVREFYMRSGLSKCY